MKSKFLTLSWIDLGKGLLVAFFSALITGLYELLQAGAALDWLTIKPVLLAAVAAMLGYLIKNLFTNSTGEFAKLEKK
jgi:uncharacterized membrane protein